MLINFFLTLRKYKVPATIRELMDLLKSLQLRIVYSNIDDFYLLSRTCMVKDEKITINLIVPLALILKGWKIFMGCWNLLFQMNG